jgi:excisionase family DNA binding protein
MNDHPSEKDWLGQGEAAQYLGIHPVTLRRWAADAGEINYMVTAGGHRRLAATELKRFAEERLHLTTQQSIELLWADNAVAQLLNYR